MIDRIEQIIADVKDYVNLKIDSAKLQTIEGIADVFGRLVGLILTIMVGTLALLMFVAVAVVFLAKLLDSLLLAFLIMGVILFVAAWLIYIFRGRVFVDLFVKSLCSIMFKNK